MTTARSVARRYARALLDVAVRTADPEQVERDLTEFVTLFEREPLVRSALYDPTRGGARKRALLEALLARAGETTPLVGRLLLLLAERGRLPLLAEIVEAYRAGLLEHRRGVRAHVTTAAPLSAAAAEALAARLATVTGRTVTLVTEIDPGLLGGVVARVGSVIYDGSLRRQLERVRERLEHAV